MVEDAQHRGRAVRQPLDQRDLPQRAGAVEVFHLRQASELEDIGERPVGRQCRSPHVEVEIEIRAVLPARRRVQRRLHHLLTQHRELTAQVVDPSSHVIPVRQTIEQHHRHHRRAQSRVAFHRPCERVTAPHEFVHHQLLRPT